MRPKHLYCALLYISAISFLLTLFSPQTILLSFFTVYLLFKYLSSLINEYIERGVSSLLSEQIKNHLINRSLFDILCDFWFMESLNIIKVCIKPIMGYVQPQNAAQVLEQLSPEMKQKFLKKGIVNIIPEECRKIFISNQEIQKYTNYKDQIQIKNNQQTQPSIKTYHQYVRPKSESIINQSRKIQFSNQYQQSEDQINSFMKQPYQISSKTIVRRKDNSPKWDRLEFYKSIQHQIQSEGILKTLKGVMSMVKSVIELKNLPENIQRIHSSLIIKLMVFFWLAIIIQVRMSPKARKFIFRSLYILNGFMTVTGALGSSAILFYKYYNVKKDNRQILN